MTICRRRHDRLRGQQQRVPAARAEPMAAVWPDTPTATRLRSEARDGPRDVFGGLGPKFNTTSCSLLATADWKACPAHQRGRARPDGGPCRCLASVCGAGPRRVWPPPRHTSWSISGPAPTRTAPAIAHRPRFELTQAYAPLPAFLEIKLRASRAGGFGLGLLEAVLEADILPARIR
jgi:hypothetical protein